MAANDNFKLVKPYWIINIIGMLFITVKLIKNMLLLFKIEFLGYYMEPK